MAEKTLRINRNASQVTLVVKELMDENSKLPLNERKEINLLSILERLAEKKIIFNRRQVKQQLMKMRQRGWKIEAGHVQGQLIARIIRKLKEKHGIVDSDNIFRLSKDPQINPLGITFSRPEIAKLRKKWDEIAKMQKKMSPEERKGLAPAMTIEKMRSKEVSPITYAVLALAWENKELSARGMEKIPINPKTVFELVKSYHPEITYKHVQEHLSYLRTRRKFSGIEKLPPNLPRPPNRRK